MKATTFLDRLQLTRLGESAQAGLWITSLPWPKESPLPLSLGGVTSVFPLGKWPNTKLPRRLLLVAQADGSSPETLALSKQAQAPSGASPEAKLELFEKSPDFENAWESHALRLSRGARSLGLLLGLKTGGTIHWWEACRLVLREQSETCTVVEMSGSIPKDRMTLQELNEQVGYSNSYLHRHNWLTGRIFARLHSNGVCEISVSHINNKFVDDGADLPDVVPIIGILNDARTDAETACLVGAWDGTRTQFSLGGVAFDVREVARLATVSQPGEMSFENGVFVWQPYQGVDVFGGLCPKARTGDPFIFHAEQKMFPKGMARTLRFSLSLSDHSPVVVRYLPPDWWYGLCGELVPDALLPVSSEYDPKIEEARRWVLDHSVSGGFEDGSVARSWETIATDKEGKPRWEPGWEGEMPYAQFLTAWRTGRAEDYGAAMRSAGHFTDVAVDHASKLIRMHGFAPDAFSLPMNRVMGTLAAYLETGDPFFLDTAKAVLTTAHWQHKNSWPRMTVGRDACYLRSAVFFYRYFGCEFFLEIAKEVAQAVVESQRDNGSFGDQGGGSGVHQWSGYISKPWMGLLAVNGLLDYLELFPGEDVYSRTVKKFADWLMSERGVVDGKKVWFYQHDYNGGRDFTMPHTTERVTLPGPHPWHHATLARLMAHCTMRFGDPAYLDAWAESFAATDRPPNDHSIAAALQFLPWLQMRLWNARMTPDGIQTSPVVFGNLTPRSAVIHTPDGHLSVYHGEDPGDFSEPCATDEPPRLGERAASPVSDAAVEART